MSKFTVAEAEYSRLKDLDTKRTIYKEERAQLLSARQAKGLFIDIRPESNETRLQTGLPYISLLEAPFNRERSLLVNIIDERISFLTAQIESLNKQLD